MCLTYIPFFQKVTTDLFASEWKPGGVTVYFPFNKIINYKINFMLYLEGLKITSETINLLE